MNMRIKIGYLGQVYEGTAEVAAENAATYSQGVRIWPRPVAGVASTQVDVDVADHRIASLSASWGDCVKRGESPAVYGTLADGSSIESGTVPGEVRVAGYYVADASLSRCLADAKAAVRDAWLADIAQRPEVSAVVEHYRSAVLDELDRIYAAHAAQWEADTRAIARLFRRAKVEVGEQTVPGLCCVRSTRGKMLGYARVWDGRWLGTVERLA